MMLVPEHLSLRTSPHSHTDMEGKCYNINYSHTLPIFQPKPFSLVKTLQTEPNRELPPALAFCQWKIANVISV